MRKKALITKITTSLHDFNTKQGVLESIRYEQITKRKRPFIQF